MSQETSQWLNTMTLIGFTDKRGNAWHYSEGLQGDEPNHYPGAIPMDDVRRRLFDFTVEPQPIYILTDHGYVEVEGRKAQVTSDTEDVLGIFKDGYQGHDYTEWLLDNVGTILGDGLAIASAGLLRNRAQAWVQVELEDNATAAGGFEFRPFITAYTSFDGSLATGYGRGVQAVVCDNTLAAARSEMEGFKLRHTKYSALRIGDARDALGIVFSMADDFRQEVERLTAWKVTDRQFFAALDALVPVPEEDGRGKTVAEKKRDEIVHLYRADGRSAAWNGTAFGVLQAHNTWSQHFAQVRKGVARKDRNVENFLRGKVAAADAQVLQVLETVCV